MPTEQDVLTAAQGWSLRTKLEIAGILLAACAVWYSSKPAPVAPVGEVRPAQEAHEITDVPHETIHPAAVIVHTAAAKTDLGLSPKVIADPAEHVVVADTVKCQDDHPQTVVALLNDQTGVVTNEQKTEPLPWIAVETKSDVGLYYGFKRGVTVLRGAFNYEVLEVKALHFGVTASVDNDGELFAGVGVKYKF